MTFMTMARRSSFVSNNKNKDEVIEPRKIFSRLNHFLNEKSTQIERASWCCMGAIEIEFDDVIE